MDFRVLGVVIWVIWMVVRIQKPCRELDGVPVVLQTPKDTEASSASAKSISKQNIACTLPELYGTFAVHILFFSYKIKVILQP